jgi:hypothetical protein
VEGATQWEKRWGGVSSLTDRRSVAGNGLATMRVGGAPRQRNGTWTGGLLQCGAVGSTGLNRFKRF